MFRSYEGTRKGSVFYQCKNFEYRKNKECTGGTIYVKCTNAHCTGRGVIKDGTFSLTKDHLHPSLPESHFKVLAAKSSMKRKAEQSASSLRDIYEATAREEGIVGDFTFRQIASTLSKRRQRMFLPLPRTPQQVAEMLECETQLYAKNNIITSHEELMMTDVKTEVNETEDNERTLKQTGQDTMHDCSEDDTRDNLHETDTADPLAANITSGPIRKVYTCQWIKTEAVEKNETSDVFHQFQSEPVDKSERKWGTKHESVTSVSLTHGETSSWTTESFEQSQFKNFEVKLEPFTDFESNSFKTIETVVDIKTEPVEENETSDVFHQFQSEAVDKSESKEDIKHEFLTSVGLSCGQIGSGSTGNFEQSLCASSEIKLEPISDSESNNSRHTEPVYFSNSNIKVEFEDGPKTDPDEPSTRFSANIQRPDISNYHQTDEATDLEMTDTSIDEDEDKSSGDEQEGLGSNKPATSVTTTPRPFVCVECGQGFTQKAGLRIHKLKHSDIRKFVCDVCQKSFKYSGSLAHHKLTHTDAKLFVCEVCHKSFARRSRLTRHKLTHTDIKEFVCDVCNKSFNQSGNLTQHKLTHTDQKKPFVCDVCNKHFSRKSHMIQHKLIHTDFKPFVCDICNRGFKTFSNLTQHKWTHTDQSPYVCDVCNKSFTRRNLLTRHRLTHTDIK